MYWFWLPIKAHHPSYGIKNQYYEGMLIHYMKYSQGSTIRPVRCWVYYRFREFVCLFVCLLLLLFFAKLMSPIKQT